MSRFLTLSLILFSALPAAALKRPQTKAELAELAAIGSLMASEKTAYEASFVRLKLAHDKAREKIDNEPQIAALEQQLATLNASHAVVMNNIVKRTVTLFDIQPGPTSGHIVGGEFLNTSPPWSPTFAPQVEQKIILVPNKPSITLSAHGPYAGITWADGSVELNEKAFLSPGYLAAVIIHESVHFAQMTTVGRGDSITAVRAEIEAHSKSSSPDVAVLLGLTTAEEDLLKAAFRENIRRFQNNPSRSMISMQFVSPTSPEPIREQGDLGFLDSLQQGGAVVAEKVEAERAVLAREREAQENWRREKARVMAQIAQMTADTDRKFPPLRRSRLYLKALAGESCADPSRLPSLAEAGKIIRVDIALNESSYDEVETLSDCQRVILDNFDSARRGGAHVTSNDFMRWAHVYRAAHPSFIKKLANSFTGFFEIFGSLFENNGGGSRGSQDGERDANRSAPSDGCIYTYIPELNQTVRGCPVN